MDRITIGQAKGIKKVVFTYLVLFQPYLIATLALECLDFCQQGAGVSGFGCFCWELKSRKGVTNCRPIFIASDNFVKGFRVKQQRVFVVPQTTPIEEVNYSQLAIKFSKSLTKDMVFSGIRDIIKKVGEYIERGSLLEIHFSFGTLTAKENKIKFTFNQVRLQEVRYFFIYYDHTFKIVCEQACSFLTKLSNMLLLPSFFYP